MGFYDYFRKHKETGVVEPIAEGDVEVVEATAVAAPAFAPAAAAAGRVPDGQAELARFQAELAAERKKNADLETQARAAAADRLAERVEAMRSAGVAEANVLIKARRLMPPGGPGYAAVIQAAAQRKAGLPLDNIDFEAAAESLKAGIVPHSLTASAVDDAAAKAAGVFPLPNGSKGSDVDPETAGRESYKSYVASQRRPAPAN